MKIRLNDLKCSEYRKCEFLVKKHIWSVKLYILKPLLFASKRYTSVPTQHKMLIMQYLKKLYSFAPPLSIIKLKLLTYYIYWKNEYLWVTNAYFSMKRLTKYSFIRETLFKKLLWDCIYLCMPTNVWCYILKKYTVVLLLFKWEIKFPI